MNKQAITDTVLNTLRDHPVSACRRPAALRKSLRKKLRRIKQSYRSGMAREDKSPVQLWLCDNFYVLEKEAKQTLRELSGCPRLPSSAGGPQLYFVCEAALDGRPAVDQDLAEQLVKGMQERRDLTVPEFGFLPLALRTALLGIACAACVDGEDDEAISYAVTSLTRLSSVDFDELVCKHSIVEATLMLDPAGIYPDMEDESRGNYRALVSLLAERRGVSERATSQEILNLARAGSDERSRHVGSHLLRTPDLERSNSWRRWMTLCGTPAISLALAASMGVWARSIWVGILSILPVWEAVRYTLERIAMARVRVEHIPRMDRARSAEIACSTVVAVSTLLPSAADAPKAARRLEELYWSNAADDLTFCLLADFKESATPMNPEDESRVKAMSAEVARLNERYGGRFLLFVRKREYNKTQGRFSGWERKRGAITELIRYAHGDVTSVLAFVGERERLTRMRHLLVLDADTNLLFDTAGQFLSAAAHPLNRPVVDEARGIVIEGYGILVPRMATALESQAKTPFSRVMAGVGGVTTYDRSAGDFYQDLFHESIFSGKGLIDTECFYKLLNARFPENLILSHDILEGAYLRTALLSDVELTDSVPTRPSSWLARLHRWVRGDWQNLRYIFLRRGNPINALSRIKLLDNLRRSLTPAAALACVLAAFFLPVRAALALFWAALLPVAWAPLWEAALGVASNGWQVFSRRFFTRVLPQAIEPLARGVYNLVLLPQTALCELNAAGLALWRQWVSKKKLLEWVTAADSERGGGFAAAVRQYWLAELIGLIVLLFAPHAFLHLYGLAFSALIPLALYSGREKPHTGPELSRADREELTGYCASMWRFFETFATEQENWLPPDNIQQSPTYAVARRTSPTNIGLMLLSMLTARDLDFISSSELCGRAGHVIETLERMEKWNGNLYNWYDTGSLTLLEPRFVSAVDSGNFVCCLVAFREGLRDYLPECPALATLMVRVRALIDATDLSVFYNARRSLLSIGYNASTGEMMDSYYDFFMSEARMAGYYAVASRQVPKRHWGAMSRTMSQQGGYAGPVSWTGTMFEYFMPHLLLPVYEGSLLSEALDYCLYCQRRRVREEKTPWGISESAFYRFDGQLNYQYKAHGVQKLGVKRGLDDELVISPYSTFLVLPVAPVAAMKNLRRMREEGFSGAYGFFEAIDYTENRVPSRYGVCRSFMSHHIGMSLTAADNALFSGRMQQRFLRDHRMNAAKELLQEKVCRDTVMYDDVKFKDMKERDPVKTVIAEEYEQISPERPQAILLANGALSDLLTDTGAGWLSSGRIDLTRRPGDLLQNPAGIYAFLQVGERSFSLTAAPLYDAQVRYRVQFAENNVIYKAKYRSVKTGLRVLLHPTLPLEQREYQIKNLTQQRTTAQLLCYLEPTLAPTVDYKAHPAFSKLFVTAEYEAQSRILLFTRRERRQKTQTYLAVGFLEDLPFEYETRRERLMNAPDGLAGLAEFATREFAGGAGTPDAACALRLHLELPAGGRAQVTQLIAAGETREEAIGAIVSQRAQGRIQSEKAPNSLLVGDTIEGRLAFAVLPSLCFPAEADSAMRAARAQNRLGKDGLWGMSISGDRPIVLYPTDWDWERGQAEAYLALYKKCKLAGVPFDLVFTAPSDLLPVLRDCMEQMGCADQIGNGVFLIDSGTVGEAPLRLLEASAVHIAPRSGVRVWEPGRPHRPVCFLPVSPQEIDRRPDDLEVTGGIFSQGRFYVQKQPGQALPFSHILANSTFGTLVGDSFLGFTWAVNARENRLTPWHNDITAGNLGERLVLRLGDRFFDLIHGSLCSYGQRSARYEGRIDGLSTCVEVTVPAKGCVKQVEVRLQNRGADPRRVTLAYYTEPVLGVDRGDARQITAEFSGGCLVCHNPFQTAVRGVSALCCGEKAALPVTNRADFLCGRWDEAEEADSEPCAALLVELELAPWGERAVHFRLVWAAHADAARRLASLDLPPAEPVSALVLHTPDEPLNRLVSDFLPHQILQCRIWGRTAFYQCGGAYGFRDQLQDATACLLFAPHAAKYQILRAAAAQFPEGDVLHWWHNLPHSGGGLRGVRTKYSDDLLWLPYAVCEYVETTGDRSLLSIPVPFVEGELLGAEEKERYFEPRRSVERASVYEHCARTIRRAAARLGPHGLPLIGSGDWNDGFNTVGTEGKGESVWLALFLAMVLRRFLPLAEAQGDAELAQLCAERMESLKTAVDAHCWDGAWYLRAFYDDGSPMGSRENDECTIDSLPQSFAALCPMPDRARVSTALDSALHFLADPQLRIVKLFDRPFADSSQQPGYVKAYPAGIRENGGQYTHASVWLAMALLHEGRAEDGWRLLDWFNPASRCRDQALALRYQLEPYYLAADIYSASGAAGRGGWSMYTGASSWYYRTVVERLLGIRRMGGTVTFSPCIPPSWKGCSFELNLEGTAIHFTARWGDHQGMSVNGLPADAVTLDGTPKDVEYTLEKSS
ncbi:hypothetical protein H8711_01155 [Clostridiaceae bacterium NSJ-31]|uniref:Uncharacterized protein n=1 Tax=Ligaoa zhengdingensis TaxID=2763658 RepID=A0A926DUJ6_9FIRM|nr:glucoamylase family protein [Ligaoa zhengdingensis]MBC8545545.1 hypothetical protein [Ligaoa zhengdingensis]